MDATSDNPAWPFSPAYWDKRAADFPHDPARCVGWYNHPYEHHEELTRKILRPLATGKRALDVACGFGRFSMLVDNAGGWWTGVDFSPGMRRLWIQQGGIGHFILGNAREASTDWCQGTPFGLIFHVGSIKTLQLNSEQFIALYQPLLSKGGCIALFEANECRVFFNF